MEIKDREDLLRTLQLDHQGECIELGVLRGDFSEKILELTHCKRLWLVDLWDRLENTAFPGL